MKMRPGLMLGLAGICLTLAGCAPSQVASPYLKTVARNIEIAKAYDSGARAARFWDMAGLRRAVGKLRSLEANSFAYDLSLREPFSAADDEVMLGVRLDTRAANTTDGKSELEKEAARHYRRALQLEPNFDSPWPLLLNSLGYHLADKGTSTADYILAEQLTRRAIGILDGVIAAREKDGFAAGDEKYERAITRDSLAWALYRQQRFAQALKEQREAVREAKAGTRPLDSELISHLAEIEKAAGRSSRTPTEAPAAEGRALEIRPRADGSVNVKD